MANFVLSEIWIYPVKSLGGIKIDQGVVLKKGLQHDRRWMLVDAQGLAMTQRVFHEMALFRPEISGDTILIRYIKSGKMISSIEFDTSHSFTKQSQAQIWNDKILVGEVDPGVSAWFSRHLGIPCKLVAFPEANPRAVDPEYAVGDDHVSLADAYPFLAIGKASLDDLNRRLDEPVGMNRFRPNLVFTGGEPFAEDHWGRLTIGSVPFAAVKKSARCILTTVDQNTGIRGPEPLRTLSTFRKVDNKVFFGQNMIALGEGILTVGDPIIPD